VVSEAKETNRESAGNEADAEALAGTIAAQSGPGDLRTALRDLRDAVETVAAAAAVAAETAGHALDRGVLANAIMAVLGEPDAFELLRAARLVEIPEGGGLDLLTRATATRPASEARTDSSVDDSALESANREARRRAETALAAAREHAATAERALRDAESKTEEADRRLRSAQEEALARRDRARAEAENTAARLLEAEKALQTATRA
jgi:chromosome segregation protein